MSLRPRLSHMPATVLILVTFALLSLPAEHSWWRGPTASNQEEMYERRQASQTPGKQESLPLSLVGTPTTDCQPCTLRQPRLPSSEEMLARAQVCDAAQAQQLQQRPPRRSASMHCRVRCQGVGKRSADFLAAPIKKRLLIARKSARRH